MLSAVFAARAGAKHVYAIEASGVADKARENIKRNSLEGIIT
jgi:protein arginine N-methyltransferase 3